MMMKPQTTRRPMSKRSETVVRKKPPFDRNSESRGHENKTTALTEVSVPDERQGALAADWLLGDALCEVKGHDGRGLGESPAGVLPQGVWLRLPGLTEIQGALRGGKSADLYSEGAVR